MNIQINGTVYTINTVGELVDLLCYLTNARVIDKDLRVMNKAA